jgi:hypothetical protein
MGFFDSLFGPSWADRVTVHMQKTQLPIHERIRSCVNDLTPKADGGDISQGLPVTEIRKCLVGLPEAEEMGTLAAAMHLRKSMRIPVVAMKVKSETKWQLSMITDKARLPDNDGNRYRRFENENLIIWNPVDDYGNDLTPCPK